MSFSTILSVVLVLLCWALPARASQFGAILAGPAGGWLLFLAALAGLVLFARLCRVLATYLTEQTHSSRVSRLMDVLASQAEGIAGVLMSHPPASEATLRTVREAAIAQSIAYVKVNLPDTLRQIDVTDGTIATRLGNYVTAILRDGAAVATAEGPAGDLLRAGLAAAAPQPAATPAS